MSLLGKKYLIAYQFIEDSLNQKKLLNICILYYEEEERIVDYEVYGDKECKLIYSFVPSRYRKDKDVFSFLIDILCEIAALSFMLDLLAWILSSSLSFYWWLHLLTPTWWMWDFKFPPRCGSVYSSYLYYIVRFKCSSKYFLSLFLNVINLVTEEILSLSKLPNVHLVTYTWLFDSISNIQLCDYVKYSVHVWNKCFVLLAFERVSKFENVTGIKT